MCNDFTIVSIFNERELQLVSNVPQYFGEDCILGSSIEISRRSQNQCCLNGRDFVREFDYTVCSCEAEDFEW